MSGPALSHQPMPSMMPGDLAGQIAYTLKYVLCINDAEISLGDLYVALALSVRNTLVDGLAQSRLRDRSQGCKKVHYLSMEFLVGKCTENNLLNLGLYGEAETAIGSYGYALPDVLHMEHDPALGNGGLGRLAACFLDSMATLDIAGFGYGINYDYGLFRQSISNGYQKESPDAWRSDGAPWLIEQHHKTKIVPIFGNVLSTTDGNGAYNPSWMNWQTILGVPYDMPIVSGNGTRTNFLRLYSAKASDEFDIKVFNDGDYFKAIENKIDSERISKILYPEDSREEGKELRLLQEYFFVACAIRDIVDDHRQQDGTLETFARYNAIQLNDTHPALAIAELMRLMVDEHRLPWELAWEQTQAACSYTNHTLLPEALERWSEPLLARVLPRHNQIIREIDRRFVDAMLARGIDRAAIDKMCIIKDSNDGSTSEIHMANLSIIGSHATNGVAALHTDLIKSDLVPEFYRVWPERFQNKTNGVTPRRWLKQANPRLAALITDAIGPGWMDDLSALRGLEVFATDSPFQEKFRVVKDSAKRDLAALIYTTTRIRVDPDTIFDIQVKRIHEYKRQLLNVLQIIDTYLEISDGGAVPRTPATYVFSGKAAPGYFMAKRIIKLINAVATVVNQDPTVSQHLKVAYVPDYRVSVAERIFPAANLSEQISTAGFEASGTGNMKFMMNGALTIGTMDGANVEICEEAGSENIYIFGKSVDEIAALKTGGYNPWDFYHNNPRIQRVLDALNSDLFAPGEPGLFEPIYYSLLSGGDYFCLLADFQDYVDCKTRVLEDFQDQQDWTRKAILNIARSGKFSSDRTIAEYARDIWGIDPSNAGAA